GWDPGALAEFLSALERAESLTEGASKQRSSFFATHPSTPDRVAKIQAEARSLSRTPVASIAGTRAALLGRLEGLVIGDNAANWKTANSPEAAGAVAPDEAAVVFVHVVGDGDDPVAGAKADGLTDDQIQKV